MGLPPSQEGPPREVGAVVEEAMRMIYPACLGLVSALFLARCVCAAIEGDKTKAATSFLVATVLASHIPANIERAKRTKA